MHWTTISELQEWLDKYEDKIKFIHIITSGVGSHKAGSVLLIIDEA